MGVWELRRMGLHKREHHNRAWVHRQRWDWREGERQLDSGCQCRVRWFWFQLCNRVRQQRIRLLVRFREDPIGMRKQSKYKRINKKKCYYDKFHLTARVAIIYFLIFQLALFFNAFCFHIYEYIYLHDGHIHLSYLYIAYIHFTTYRDFIIRVTYMHTYMQQLTTHAAYIYLEYI